jgi:hypothetical protein
MRDDLHIGAPLPARWKAVIRAMTRDHDWHHQAVPKAEGALAADVISMIKPAFIANIRRVLENGLGSSVFGAENNSVGLLESLDDFKRAQLFHPFESKCIDYLRRHSLQINKLNADEFVRSAVAESCAEHVESIHDAALAHIALKARSQVAEARRRLGSIAATIDIEGLGREAVAGRLKVPKRVQKRPIGMDTEDLR